MTEKHEEEERPFDPERRGSWRGSGRELVVNPNQFEKDLRELVDASKLSEPDEAFEKAKAILDEGGDADDVMRELNELLDMHGVEAYPPNAMHPKGLYLNSGDTYNATLVYSYDDDKYFVSTYGDLVEAEEPKVFEEAWDDWIRRDVERCVRRDIEHDIDMSESEQDRLLGLFDDFHDDELHRIFDESIRDVKNAEMVIESDGSVFVHRMKEVCSETSDRVITKLRAMAPNARRQNGGAMTAEEFMAQVKAEADVRGRSLRMSFSPDTGQLFIDLWNLPELPAGQRYDGAEAHNNRFMFVVDGFSEGRVNFGKGTPIAATKVRLEHKVNSGSRDYRLRGKSGAPDQVARYLAKHLTKIAAEVPPKYTHSRAPNARGKRGVVYRVRGTADHWKDEHMRFGLNSRTITGEWASETTAHDEAEKFMKHQEPIGRNAKVWIEESHPSGDFRVIAKWTGQGGRWVPS